MTRRLSSPAFVGRAEELAQLTAALGSAEEGRGATVLLAGEAGIGKTRLVEEFRDRAEATGVRVATAAASPGMEEVPYGPLLELVEDLEAPEIADALLAPASAGRAQVLALATRTVSELVEARPLALVFEDLHWADPATCHLFALLSRRLRNAPLLLVGTHRLEESGASRGLESLLAEIGRSSALERIEVGRMTAAEVRLQLEGILGEPPAAHLADEMYERAQGNPFFTEEALDAASGGTARTLKAMVLSRLGRLTPQGRDLVATASVIGRQAPYELLRATTTASVEALDAALEEALGHGILVASEEQFAFRHALLSEAVYGTLMPGEKARRHADVAACLEREPRLGSESAPIAAGELAHHWHRANRPPEALRSAVAAAAEAAKAHAPSEAYLHYERALEGWERVVDAESVAGIDAVTLRESAAAAASEAGENVRAAALYESVFAALDSQSERRRAALALERQGRSLWLASGDVLGASERTEKALLLLEDDGPSAARARVLAAHAANLMIQLRHADCIAPGREAVELAEAHGDSEAGTRARLALGPSLVALGETADGLEQLRVAIEIAREEGDSMSLAVGGINLAETLVSLAEIDEAARVGLLGLDNARAAGLERVHAAALAGTLTEALLLLGRWDEADTISAAALEDEPERWSRIAVACNRALLATRRGDLEEAEGLLTSAVAAYGGVNDPQFEALLEHRGAELALARGDHADARKHIASCERHSVDPGASRLAGEAALLAVTTEAAALDALRTTRRDVDPAASMQIASAACARLEDLAEEAHHPPLRAYLEGLVALAIAERSRIEPNALDPELWRRACELWTADPHRLATARWRFAEAILSTGGSRALAGEALGEALGIAEELPAPPLAAAITDLSRRARIPLDGEDPSPPAEDDPLEEFGLTPREREILGHLARGETNAEIAEALFISQKTASVHVSNILGKLDVKSRIQAGAIGQRLGLG